jgi:hypothetical protein
MLSKWQIWDFLSSSNRDVFKTHEGLLALKTFDPISLKLVKDYLLKGFDKNVLHHKLGSEITKSWIEEEFLTLSLFGNSDNFFIHQSNDISSDVWELLSSIDLSGRTIFLSFENELGPWKKMVKEGKITSLLIEEPRFWEFNKLLDFVCNYLRLPLSFESKGWILDSLENDLGSFYNACYLLKMNCPEASEIQLFQVKELLVLEKLDQFQLASFFSRKKNHEFYSKLISLEGDFEKMRSFFMFMQSHLIKMIDTSYLNQKSRLTQYDKEIQSTSKLWSQSELMLGVERFNEWEILSKKKNGLLWTEIKKYQLRSF